MIEQAKESSEGGAPMHPVIGCLRLVGEFFAQAAFAGVSLAIGALLLTAFGVDVRKVEYELLILAGMGIIAVSAVIVFGARKLWFGEKGETAPLAYARGSDKTLQ